MSIDLTPLREVRKLLFSVPLTPVQGRRFQPTGFPDLGAATYLAPSENGDTVQCLLVESAQSMANRMELTIWDDGANQLQPVTQGLSYVRVLDQQGNYLTSSIVEAHRLNSVYIEKAEGDKFHKQLKQETGYDDKKPIDRRKFLETVMKYDVNSLLHGVFLESVGGRLRLARAMSGFIEAEQVEVVASGGVKNDSVQPGTEKGGTQTAAEGYGNVPFAREEYTAQNIRAYFNVDLAQIRGYGLGDSAERLLTLLALYKIRSLLDGDLRLRTACNFEVDSDNVTAERPAGYGLPEKGDLERALPEAISLCAEQFGGEKGVTTVAYSLKNSKK